MNIITRVLNRLNLHVVSKLSRIIFKITISTERYRFLNTNPSAIGHLASDVDCFLKAHELGHHSFKGILLSPKGTSANEFLLNCWELSPNLIIIRNRLCCYFLDYLRIFDDTGYDCSVFQGLHGQPAKLFEITNLWGEKAPVIQLTLDIETKGKQLLKELIPDVDENKIVLLHSRDNHFDLSESNPNQFTQNYRNSSINSLKDVVHYLRSRDFKVIRIGEYNDDCCETKEYFELKGLTVQDRRLLECYLAKIQRLFLGSMSGPCTFAYIWNKPIFRVNCVPYEALRAPTTLGVSIPKLLEQFGKVLPIKNIYQGGIHSFCSDKSYADAGINLIMNDPKKVLNEFILFFEVFVAGTAKLEDNFELDLQEKYTRNIPTSNFDYAAKSFIATGYLRKLGVG